jgi:LPXTG-motif cell wall-anchored protein
LISITNIPGAVLPNTGGPGARLFMILGSILILGAGVLLWSIWLAKTLKNATIRK